jgi:acyl-CoA thioesterase
MHEKLDRLKADGIKKLFPSYPFPALVGIEIDELEYGFAKLRLQHRDNLTQGLGYIHGGVISSLCDTAVGVALFTMIEPEEKILTIELKVNFIAPAAGNIIAEGRILHKGRKTAVGEVSVVSSENALLAKALITYYVYRD